MRSSTASSSMCSSRNSEREIVVLCAHLGIQTSSSMFSMFIELVVLCAHPELVVLYAHLGTKNEK